MLVIHGVDELLTVNVITRIGSAQPHILVKKIFIFTLWAKNAGYTLIAHHSPILN